MWNHLRNRVSFWSFVVLAWVIVAVPNLDGAYSDSRGEDVYSFWRMLAAWYVFVFGLTLLLSLVARIPSWLDVVAWSGFGAGMLFWATVATTAWPLWFCIGVGAFFMAFKSAVTHDRVGEVGD